MTQATSRLKSQPHPADWAMLACTFVITATLLIRGLLAPEVEVMGWAGFFMALLGSYGGWVFWLGTRTDERLTDVLRTLSVMAMVGLLYKTLAYVPFTAFPWRFDEALARADLWLFAGKSPSLEAARWATPPRLEFFSFFYAIYIPYMYMSFILCMAGFRAGAHRELVTAFAILYGIGYMGYLFVPAYGPILHFSEQLTHLKGGFFWNTIEHSLEKLGGPHGAFPSLHIGTSFVLCFMDLRHNRLRGWIYAPVVVMIMIATVITQYHYVVDLAAGGILGALSVWAALWLRRSGKLGENVRTMTPCPPEREAAPEGKGDEQILSWALRLGGCEAKANPTLIGGGKSPKLAGRMRSFRQRLNHLGLRPEEILSPVPPPLAFVFVLREAEILLVGLPAAVWGVLNHIVPVGLLIGWNRNNPGEMRLGSLRKLRGASVVFPVFYIAQMAGAWVLLPWYWATAYCLALPYSAWLALLYRERAGESLRRASTFMRFVFQPSLKRSLAEEANGILRELKIL